MKIGKVPENVLESSVFKQLHTKRTEVVLGAGIGEDCTAVKLAEDEIMVLSTDPITGTAKDNAGNTKDYVMKRTFAYCKVQTTESKCKNTYKGSYTPNKLDTANQGTCKITSYSKCKGISTNATHKKMYYKFSRSAK